MGRSLKLRRVRLVLKEFTVEPVFCLVLVFIGIFVFSSFIGISNIALGIDRMLYSYSLKTGIATLRVNGDRDELYSYTDEAGYPVFRVGCPVSFEVLGSDPDHVDEKTGEHRSLSGCAERMFKGGTNALVSMNNNIISGTPYVYDDNDSYCIWLSDTGAEHIGAKVGDTIKVETEKGKIDTLVKGIYLQDENLSGTPLYIRDFYLSAAFLPYFDMFEELDIIVPGLNLADRNRIVDDYFNHGFRSAVSDDYNSILIIELGVYLVALFSCIIVVSLMTSMTKLYVNKRKGFYSIIRLWGMDRRWTLFILFLFLQILYSVSFLLALPVAPFVFSSVTRAIGDFIGDHSIGVRIFDWKNIISYLVFTLCNVLAVLVNSGFVRTDDISDNIRMGVEG